MNNDLKLDTALVHKLCIICTKKTDEHIVLNRTLTKNTPLKDNVHGKAIDYGVCKECSKDKEKALMLIGFIEDKTNFNEEPFNPYRSGHIFGIKKDCEIAEFLYEQIPGAKEKGFCFVPKKALENWGIIDSQR